MSIHIFSPKIKVEGITIKPRVASTDTSYTVNITILPPNAYVIGLYGRVKTAFAGLSNPKVCVGVAGDTSRYMVAQPINVVNELMTGKLVKSSGGIRKDSVVLPDKYKKDLPHTKGFCEGMEREKISSDLKTIIATFTSDSTTFAGLTAGEVEFIIVYVDPNE